MCPLLMNYVHRQMYSDIFDHVFFAGPHFQNQTHLETAANSEARCNQCVQAEGLCC